MYNVQLKDNEILVSVNATKITPNIGNTRIQELIQKIKEHNQYTYIDLGKV